MNYTILLVDFIVSRGQVALAMYNWGLRKLESFCPRQLSNELKPVSILYSLLRWQNSAATTRTFH